MATKAEDAVRVSFACSIAPLGYLVGANRDPPQRRRERGRRSQAGFRKRQAEANQHVRDQNLRLKSAIEKLIHATRGDEDPELLNTIFDVAEAAGVDAPRPVIGAQCDDDTTTIATTTTATTAVRPRPDKHVSGNGNNSRLLTSPVDGEEEEDITIDATTRDIVRKVGDHQASPSYSSLLAPPVFSASPPQRLTCGIWLDHLHYMRVSIPPDDILPYLGPGSKTFAGILFWSMMDHSQMKCPRKPQHPHNDAASLIRRALGHSQVTAGWAVTYVQAMVEARQEYKRTGSISRRYASFAEQDLGMIM